MLISVSIFASPSYTAKGKKGNQHIAGFLHLPFIETLYIASIHVDCDLFSRHFTSKHKYF